MAGFRREPTTSRAGRKHKPTRKVRDILCESLIGAVEGALRDVREGERMLRLSMASRQSEAQLHIEYLSWKDDREEATRLLDEVRDYLPMDVYEHNMDVYDEMKTGYDELEKAVEAYSEPRTDAPPKDEVITVLMQQTQAIEEQIKNISASLAQAKLDVADEAEAPAADANLDAQQSSTPRGAPPPMIPPDLSRVPTAPAAPAASTDGAADALNRLATILEGKQSTGRLPRIEPDTFKGDLTSFPAWWNSFETMVESRARNDSERLFFLNKYTSGRANECIKGFMGLYSDEGAYRRARNVILSRFGNRLKIAEAFKERLIGWAPVKDGDGMALQAYADFLWQCHAAMETLDYLTNLNCQEENNKMAVKLPKQVCQRWDRLVDDTVFGDDPDMTEEPTGLIGHFPPFQEFCRFVSREARIMVGSCTTSAASKEGGKKKATSLATDARTGQEPSSKSHYQCPVCKGPHYLYLCKTFLEKSPEVKKSYARENGLCFGCLRRNHVYRQCKIRNPDIMRDHSVPVPAATPTARAMNMYTATLAEGELSSPIVPVWCYLSENPEHRVLSYALLDSQSSGCFMSTELAELLQLEPTTVSLELTTLGSRTMVKCGMASGLRVKGEHEEEGIDLPRCYVRGSIPGRHEFIPDPKLVSRWPYMSGVAEKLTPPRADLSFGLLIGFNCSEAFNMEDFRRGERADPFATKTPLGWTVTGCLKRPRPPPCSCTSLHTRVREVNSEDICRAFDQGFVEGASEDQQMSQEDAKFLQIVRDGIVQRDDAHFQVPLPFKKIPTDLPDSRPLAERRLASVRRRMVKDPEYGDKFAAFMNKVISTGQAEAVPMPDVTPIGRRWYWCIHGVINPRKPGKVRGVWDGAAEVQGVSINSLLLTGPDMTNNLVGVLSRFRREQVAVTCDIEGMFLQVQVDPQHRDYLRFLWFEDGDTQKPVREYRMCVSLFGAASSPGCANMALRETADRYEGKHGSEAADFLRDEFYVDDGLGATPDDDSAIALIRSSRALCAEGGFNLQKFASSSRAVMEAIPAEWRAPSLKTMELQADHMPTERTLGILLSLEQDAFLYSVARLDRPDTRRGYLAALSSIFDPLGLVGPALLIGRLILQRLCRDKFGWDDPVPEALRDEWTTWYAGLMCLDQLSIPRCVRRTAALPLKSVELHTFADASSRGYGACCYLLLRGDGDRCDTSLVYAKSRVAPNKATTIPRLELQAAVLAVKMGCFMKTELKYDQMKTYYWSDSMVVLGYILNESRRFHVYVANRTRFIRDRTSRDQWRHIGTEQNPADVASRGVESHELVATDMWWSGPAIIRQGAGRELDQPSLPVDDPEVKREEIGLPATVKDPHPIDLLLERCSSLEKVVSVMCRCLRWPGHDNVARESPVEMRQRALMIVIKRAQETSFPAEQKLLRHMAYPQTMADVRDRKQRMRADSNLYRLDVYIDAEQVLRVGGRLRRSGLPDAVVHPMVLPSRHRLSDLMVDQFHRESGHMGAVSTLNALRQGGYWLIGGRQAVSVALSRCVGCRRRRGAVTEQKMAELPEDRFEQAPPFTYAAADMFGPFGVKRGRAVEKWWVCAFVCMASRAVHLEPTSRMDVSGFMQAYRRFVARRGPVRSLRCDRGTNFTGADTEQRASWNEQERHELTEQLKHRHCDFINFRFNYPKASHMAGSWERMIRTIRAAFWETLRQHGGNLCFEIFSTLVVEAEAMVNSRPLTTVDTTDDTTPPALTPAQLLTMKPEVLAPPPGVFRQEDRYSRKRWRLTQFLAGQFWRRWVKEYALSLQPRQKWNQARDNLRVNDVVMMVDPDQERSRWHLARVETVAPSEDGLVRKVTVRTATGTLNRPVQKLILLYRPPMDE